MAKSLLTWVLFLVSQFIFSNCYCQVKLTLKQAIDSAVRRNLQAKQIQLNVMLSEVTLKQSKYNQLPNISISPQASVNWGRSLDVSTYNYITQRVFLISGNLGSQVTLFQGGQLRNLILQNKLLLQADQSNVAKTRNDLILAVATSFLKTLASEDLLTAVRQQIQLAKLQLDNVQKGLNAGNKSLADLAQARAQLANTELDEATILNQLNEGYLTLKQLMDMNDSKVELEKPNIDNIEDVENIRDTIDLFRRIVSVNPDVAVTNYQKLAALQGVKVAESALAPTVSLYGSIGSNFSDARSLLTGTQQTGFDTIGKVVGTNQAVLTPAFRSITKNYNFIRQFTDNFYQSTGLTVQIPIFNRFYARTNIKKAKLYYQTAKLNEDITISNLKKIIGQAVSDVRTAKTRLLAIQSNYDATKQILTISKKRYEAGLINSLDYNTVITNHNKSQFDLIQARYDLLFRRKIIQYYLGETINL